MAKKNKTLYGIHIPISIYGEGLAVIWGDMEQALAYIKMRFKNGAPIDDNFINNTSAFVYTSNPDVDNVPEVMYIGEKPNNYSYIAHELGHYCMFLLSSRGVTIIPEDGDHHEPFTYLLGYMTDEITKLKKTDWFIWGGENHNVWRKQKPITKKKSKPNKKKHGKNKKNIQPNKS